MKNIISEKLGVIFDEKIRKIFSKRIIGDTSSKDLPLTFDKIQHTVNVCEVLSNTKAIKETIYYKAQISQDNLPQLPDNSFIFALDSNRDYFLLNPLDGSINYCGEITFYEPVLLELSFSQLEEVIDKVEKEDYAPELKFTVEQVNALNSINNSNLEIFLSNVNYGIVSLDLSNKGDNKNGLITFVFGFDYMEEVNPTDKLKSSNLFHFGMNSNNKDVYLNLKTLEIELEDGTVVGKFETNIANL